LIVDARPADPVGRGW